MSRLGLYVDHAKSSMNRKSWLGILTGLAVVAVGVVYFKVRSMIKANML